MNGILVIDKPQGFTSFDVVAKLRGICATRKIGHSGTLDPMATGVLPVFVGRAVKAVDLQPRKDKTYVADILFGMATDTGDITGEVLQTADVHITSETIKDVLPRFLGAQQQLPPMYSAVKINGRPLYSYAREGKEIERKPRPVEVFRLELLGGGDNRFTILAHCSAGTYIRTLAEDIGAALGAPATLAALRRTAAGVFGEKEAHTLEAVQQARNEGWLESLFLSVETPFMEMPPLALGPGARQRLLNGGTLPLEGTPPGRYRASDAAGFLGLVRVGADGCLRSEKLLCER